jgi:hypothetical protein
VIFKTASGFCEGIREFYAVPYCEVTSQKLDVGYTSLVPGLLDQSIDTTETLVYDRRQKLKEAP